MTEADELTAYMAATIVYARTMERLAMTMNQIKHVADALKASAEIEPELLPELQTAGDHLLEAGAAIERAAEFMDLRQQTATARVTAATELRGDE